MAVTKVDIASRALIMIGASPISSFSDDSTEGLVTNNIYEEIVEATLTRHRWGSLLVKNNYLFYQAHLLVDGNMHIKCQQVH